MVTAELVGPGIPPIRKEMNAGDPDWFLICRPTADGPIVVTLIRGHDSSRPALSVRVQWRLLPLSESDRVAIEAEPNDRGKRPIRCNSAATSMARPTTWITSPTRRRASRARLVPVRGEGSDPVLVYFQLDLLDRDVSANLRVYTVDPKTGRADALSHR